MSGDSMSYCGVGGGDNFMDDGATSFSGFMASSTSLPLADSSGGTGRPEGAKISHYGGLSNRSSIISGGRGPIVVKRTRCQWFTVVIIDSRGSLIIDHQFSCLSTIQVNRKRLSINILNPHIHP
jgi:hypothetical protein